MRESRTYGSVRGRAVMDVPTAILIVPEVTAEPLKRDDNAPRLQIPTKSPADSEMMSPGDPR